MTRVAAFMLLGFVVTACASVDSKDRWWKTGMTKDEFARDDEQCRQMTAVQSAGAVVAGTRVRPSAEVDGNAYAICMGAAGDGKGPQDHVPPKKHGEGGQGA